MADQNFKTSFIPSKPIQPVTRGGELGVNRGSNFLTIITIVIFLATCVVSGGVYFYKITLEKSVEGQIAELQKIKSTLDPSIVGDSDRLNTKINAIKELLENHVAPSEILALLEEHTLKTLNFDTFTYKKEDSSNISISAVGQAKGFETIVLQSDKYSATSFLRNILFSGLQPNQQTAGVRFNLSGNVDPKLILYRDKLNRESTPAPTPTVNNNSAGTSFEQPSN